MAQVWHITRCEQSKKTVLISRVKQMLQSSNVSSSCLSKLLNSFTYFCNIIICLRKKALSSHRRSNSVFEFIDRSEGTVRITPEAEELGGLYFYTDCASSSS